MRTAGHIAAAIVLTVAVLLLTFTGHGGPAHDDNPPGTVTWSDPGPNSLHACRTDCGIPD